MRNSPSKRSPKTEQITLRITPELRNWLNDEGKATGRPASTLAVFLLEQAMRETSERENMIKIAVRNFKEVGHTFDYLLENGEKLHGSEWNGEFYQSGGKAYRPVYRGLHLAWETPTEEQENGQYFNDFYEVIGFKI